MLTTYQLAVRDVDLLAATRWDRIVLDEAQHVKNATGVTARAVRRIPARHRVALTGTPVENRLTELWSIADFLNPGILGPASIFRARYSVPVERFADADAAARLRRVTRPFLLRRVKTDKAVIADLPRKWERRQWCNLTVEQATLYRAVVDEMLIKLREANAGARHKGLVLSAITKLKQVCNHPAHLLGDGTPLAGRSGKLDRLEEILANALADGDRALVFTQFARFGAMLAPYLAGRLGTEVEFLHGGTPKGARDAMVARFQDAAAGRRAAAVAEGRRHRAQPHRRQPRRAPRPLVEPRHRGAGHRPGVPHRAAPRRAGAHARLRRHDRGAHRHASWPTSARSPGSPSAAATAGSPVCPHRTLPTSSRCRPEAVGA